VIFLVAHLYVDIPGLHCAKRSAAHAAYAQNYKRYVEVAFELMISVTKSFVR
jgi:hypothetical protein